LITRIKSHTKAWVWVTNQQDWRNEAACAGSVAKQ